MQINATFGFPVPAGGQVVVIGAASAQSTAMNGHSGTVRLIATVACFIEIGTNPTAVASTSVYMAPNVPEYFAIGPASKVAVIQSAAGGSLYISQF